METYDGLGQAFLTARGAAQVAGPGQPALDRWSNGNAVQPRAANQASPSLGALDDLEPDATRGGKDRPLVPGGGDRAPSEALRATSTGGGADGGTPRRRADASAVRHATDAYAALMNGEPGA